MPARWDRDGDARDEVQGVGDTDAAAPRETAAADWTQATVRAYQVNARDNILDRTCPATEIGCQCSEGKETIGPQKAQPRAQRVAAELSANARRQLSHSFRPAVLLPPSRVELFFLALEAKTRPDPKHPQTFAYTAKRPLSWPNRFDITSERRRGVRHVGARPSTVCGCVSAPTSWSESQNPTTRMKELRMRQPTTGGCIATDGDCSRRPQPTLPVRSQPPLSSGSASSSIGDE
ncbi:uncharacterized protein IWZ02DRAFT_434817 [Phyllosticta citriasiana]|uniref:uncharacterized protein n=1 Tax=Phyllosticta citriasiana TaxID=595635 RepID=UPI0030FDD19D